ncbi:hypothetical protein NJ76_16825 [Rhodococcus sp. IITR03]|nr:hypothetical protein NJ76_16825 [Rhodococcus sp. IITR03]
MRRLVLAQARAHRGRYVASALAVLVAVAFVVTTLVLGDTVDSSITKSTAARYDGVTTVVTEGESDTEPDHLLAEITGTPGVRAAALDVSGPVHIVDENGGSGYGEAMSVASDETLRWQRLRDGRWPRPGEGARRFVVRASDRRVDDDHRRLGATAPASVEVVASSTSTAHPSR